MSSAGCSGLSTEADLAVSSAMSPRAEAGKQISESVELIELSSRRAVKRRKTCSGRRETAGIRVFFQRLQILVFRFCRGQGLFSGELRHQTQTRSCRQ